MISLSTIAIPRWRGRGIGLLPAISLLLGASLLVALETPSKPFLEKNSFYLSSAGFRVQVANDAAGRKAMNALPPRARSRSRAARARAHRRRRSGRTA